MRRTDGPISVNCNGHATMNTAMLNKTRTVLINARASDDMDTNLLLRLIKQYGLIQCLILKLRAESLAKR